MKRFYCTVCQKIRHNKHWPARITNQSDKNPAERMGVCSRNTPSHNLARKGSVDFVSKAEFRRRAYLTGVKANG